jgi:hypothetical protein
LENGEVCEVTGHPADEMLPAIPELPTFSAQTTVLTSAVRLSDGRWRLTLKNYGPAETIHFKDGRSLEMPEGGLRFEV